MRKSAGSLGLMLAVTWGLGSGAAHAAEVGTSTITFESNLWVLNGDLERQPSVPEVQKLDVPAIVVTDTLTVTPSAMDITRVDNFPANFAGGATIQFSSITTTQANTAQCMGPFSGLEGIPINPKCVLLPNPTDPSTLGVFTGKFTVRVQNQAGTAMFDPVEEKWTAVVPVDLNTDLVLDLKDTFNPDLIANFQIPGAIGDPAVGAVPFSGEIAVLEIPVVGEARPDIFTTGRVTVMAQIITNRLGDDVNGTPNGFKTFTFTSTGSVTPMKLVLVSPAVIDAFAGSGESRVPVPIIGFARATNMGVGESGTPFTFRTVPEPGILLGLGAAGLGLVFLARRRRAN